jgi:hypothetical protein
LADRHYTFEPIAIEFSARLIRTDEDMLFSGARRLVCYEPSNGRAFSLGCELKAIPTSLVASGCAVIYFTIMSAYLRQAGAAKRGPAADTLETRACGARNPRGLGWTTQETARD